MKIPTKITAGDTVSWVDSPAKDNQGNDIVSPFWTLTYLLVGQGSSVSQVLTSAQEGSGWKTTIDQTISGNLVAGTYTWQAVATASGSRLTLGTGQLEVLPSLQGSTGPFDGRAQSEKDLQAVQTAMRTMIMGGAVQEYTVAGRSVRKMQMADLIALESRLKAQVVQDRKAQTIANGQGNPHKLLVRFSK